MIIMSGTYFTISLSSANGIPQLQMLGCCMSSQSTSFFLSILIFPSTGLPSDFEGYGSLSESDEEYLDEADEDSNGENFQWSHVFTLLMILKLKSITRMIIQTKRTIAVSFDRDVIKMIINSLLYEFHEDSNYDSVVDSDDEFD